MEFIPGVPLSDIWPTLSEEEKRAHCGTTKTSLRLRPFDDEKDISRALALKSRANWEEWGRQPWTSDFFSRHLATVFSGHESVFTHGDLQRKNILVLEQGDLSSGSGKSYLVTAIVDWESAGWYPSYWEYALCFTYFDWSDDWAEKIERILKPYVKEAALMRFVGQDLDA
ncbi:hypothetical protein SCUP234_02342 [Seiridium cupressi]